MKLLFDQNLSHRLADRLADLFGESTHVRRIGLDCCSDLEIWDYAALHGFTIVTQDGDFAERSRLFGSPPKVIWLRCGNTPAAHVEKLLRRNAELLEELAQNQRLDFVEI